MAKRKSGSENRRAKQKRRGGHYAAKLNPSPESNDFMRAYCKDTVALAKAGDRDAATNILANYCNAVECDLAPEPEYLRYLAECFRAILSGDLPDEALHLRNPRHRPRDPDIDERNMEIAFAVAIMRANKLTPKAAKIETALQRQVSIDTVEQALADARKSDWYSNFLKHVLPDLKDADTGIYGLPSVSRRKK